VICWSCEREGGAGPFCAACGAILPPATDGEPDLFAVLGVPRRFDVDLAAAEAAFKRLSRQLHPDRFATSDPRARKAALSRTVQLNEAWRTLKDPMRRAEYLLELQGFGLVGDDRAGVGDPGRATRQVSAPPTLLMEILELREALAAAMRAGEEGEVRAMAATMRARAAAGMQALGTALDDPAGGRAEEAARLLVAQRYYQRFLDEVAADDAKRGEAAGG
jgi:molecular chaperone HscB